METQDPVAAYLATRQKKPAVDDPVAAYLATRKPAPTGHAGKPFVDAPEMANTHAGKAFVDAEPEPSYARQALGRAASLGRYVADDAQSFARAVTRDRGVVDFVKELKNTKPQAALKAMALGPLGLGSLMSNTMERTPSYARAQDDIRQAEESAGGMGTALSAVGAAAGLAPMAGPVVGAVRGALSKPNVMRDVGLSLVPGLGKGARGRLRGEAVKGLRGIFQEARQPVATGADAIAPAEGFLGNKMENVVEAVKAQRANTPTAAIVDAVKQAPRKQAGRTQAQFDNFAERMGRKPPAKAETMESMLARMRKEQPHEIGNVHGDADIAQGLDAPEPDLADLLRRSLRVVK